MNQPAALMEFTSHVAGKNAKVSVYPDRLEWTQQGRVTMTRALGGALVTGSLRKGGAAEMIPVRAITGVSSKKGVMNTTVLVSSASGVVEMKCSHAEADQVKSTLLRLMSA